MRKKTFYLKLIGLGVNENHTLIEKRQITIINVFSLVVLHINFYFIIYNFIINRSIDSIIGHSVTIIFMAIVMYINSIKKHYLAKIIWLTHYLISSILFSVWIEPGAHIEYFVLLTPAVSLFFFNKKHIEYVILPISFFCFCLPYYILPIYSEIVLNKLQISVEFIFMLSVFFMVLYFKVVNKKNEHLFLMEKNKVSSDGMIFEKEQEDFDKKKSNFLINLFYEIKTPITLIKDSREKLVFDIEREQNNNYIKIIDGQLNEIQKITDDIIDLNKLNEDKIILNKQPQSVNVFLNKITEDITTIFKQRKVDLQWIPLNIEVEVLFDVDLMFRGINNLLSNALKFSPKNSIVIIKLILENDDLIIEVSDSGTGIPEDELIHVFDRFYQSKNYITKGTGNGVGLNLTQQIIKKHGFDIYANNNTKVGTTFSIRIPSVRVKKIKSSNLENIKKTILLVDDYVQMRVYLKLLLNNFNIIEAENGEVALDIIKTHKIDLLLTDYLMPVMDGWELVKEVKKLNYSFPVIILTAKVDSESELAMLRLGIDNYFTKPFHKEELINSINKALGYYDVIHLEEQKEYRRARAFLPKGEDVFKEKIQNFIQENIQSFSFGVEDIAVEFNISSKTITRKTKLLFGQTPNQLILETRLLKAKFFLDEDPNLNINDLTQILGMKNASYLKKRFKERFEL